jgi:hypothetical protein
MTGLFIVAMISRIISDPQSTLNERDLNDVDDASDPTVRTKISTFLRKAFLLRVYSIQPAGVELLA